MLEQLWPPATWTLYPDKSSLVGGKTLKTHHAFLTGFSTFKAVSKGYQKHAKTIKETN